MKIYLLMESLDVVLIKREIRAKKCNGFDFFSHCPPRSLSHWYGFGNAKMVCLIICFHLRFRMRSCN